MNSEAVVRGIAHNCGQLSDSQLPKGGESSLLPCDVDTIINLVERIGFHQRLSGNLPQVSNVADLRGKEHVRWNVWRSLNEREEIRADTEGLGPDSSSLGPIGGKALPLSLSSLASSASKEYTTPLRIPARGCLLAGRVMYISDDAITAVDKSLCAACQLHESALQLKWADPSGTLPCMLSASVCDPSIINVPAVITSGSYFADLRCCRSRPTRGSAKCMCQGYGHLEIQSWAPVCSRWPMAAWPCPDVSAAAGTIPNLDAPAVDHYALLLAKYPLESSFWLRPAGKSRTHILGRVVARSIVVDQPKPIFFCEVALEDHGRQELPSSSTPSPSQSSSSSVVTTVLFVGPRVAVTFGNLIKTHQCYLFTCLQRSSLFKGSSAERKVLAATTSTRVVLWNTDEGLGTPPTSGSLQSGLAGSAADRLSLGGSCDVLFNSTSLGASSSRSPYTDPWATVRAWSQSLEPEKDLVRAPVWLKPAGSHIVSPSSRANESNQHGVMSNHRPRCDVSMHSAHETPVVSYTGTIAGVWLGRAEAGILELKGKEGDPSVLVFLTHVSPAMYQRGLRNGATIKVCNAHPILAQTKAHGSAEEEAPVRLKSLCVCLYGDISITQFSLRPDPWPPLCGPFIHSSLPGPAGSQRLSHTNWLRPYWDILSFQDATSFAVLLRWAVEKFKRLLLCPCLLLERSCGPLSFVVASQPLLLSVLGCLSEVLESDDIRRLASMMRFVEGESSSHSDSELLCTSGHGTAVTSHRSASRDIYSEFIDHESGCKLALPSSPPVSRPTTERRSASGGAGGSRDVSASEVTPCGSHLIIDPDSMVGHLWGLRSVYEWARKRWRPTPSSLDRTSAARQWSYCILWDTDSSTSQHSSARGFLDQSVDVDLNGVILVGLLEASPTGTGLCFTDSTWMLDCVVPDVSVDDIGQLWCISQFSIVTEAFGGPISSSATRPNPDQLLRRPFNGRPSVYLQWRVAQQPRSAKASSNMAVLPMSSGLAHRPVTDTDVDSWLAWNLPSGAPLLGGIDRPPKRQRAMTTDASGRAVLFLQVDDCYPPIIRGDGRMVTRIEGHIVRFFCSCFTCATAFHMTGARPPLSAQPLFSTSRNVPLTVMALDGCVKVVASMKSGQCFAMVLERGFDRTDHEDSGRVHASDVNTEPVMTRPLHWQLLQAEKARRSLAFSSTSPAIECDRLVLLRPTHVSIRRVRSLECGKVSPKKELSPDVDSGRLVLASAPHVIQTHLDEQAQALISFQGVILHRSVRESEAQSTGLDVSASGARLSLFLLLGECLGPQCIGVYLPLSPEEMKEPPPAAVGPKPPERGILGVDALSSGLGYPLGLLPGAVVRVERGLRQLSLSGGVYVTSLPGITRICVSRERYRIGPTDRVKNMDRLGMDRGVTVSDGIRQWLACPGPDIGPHCSNGQRSIVLSDQLRDFPPEYECWIQDLFARVNGRRRDPAPSTLMNPSGSSIASMESSGSVDDDSCGTPVISVFAHPQMLGWAHTYVRVRCVMVTLLDVTLRWTCSHCGGVTTRVMAPRRSFMPQSRGRVPSNLNSFTDSEASLACQCSAERISSASPVMTAMACGVVDDGSGQALMKVHGPRLVWQIVGVTPMQQRVYEDTVKSLGILQYKKPKRFERTSSHLRPSTELRAFTVACAKAGPRRIIAFCKPQMRVSSDNGPVERTVWSSGKEYSTLTYPRLMLEAAEIRAHEPRHEAVRLLRRMRENQ